MRLWCSSSSTMASKDLSTLRATTLRTTCEGGHFKVCDLRRGGATSTTLLLTFTNPANLSATQSVHHPQAHIGARLTWALQSTRCGIHNNGTSLLVYNKTHVILFLGPGPVPPALTPRRRCGNDTFRRVSYSLFICMAPWLDTPLLCHGSQY